MPGLSRRVSEIQESAIRKLDMVVREQTGVRFHRLNIGQPDVATPEPLLETIARWHPKVIAYGPASGLPECRDAAAAYHARWSPGLTGRHVAVTAGGSEALLFAFTSVCDPGDDVLVPEPYYTNYNGFATVAGATVRPIRTRLADGFRIPPDDVLDAAVGPRTKAVVFANPGNPTGAVYDKAELTRLLAWAARRDLFVIADEVYRRIWFETPPTSALEFEEHRERVIVVDSLSKTYSACGIRVGFFVSRNEALMERIERLGQARLGVQPLAQQVAITALGLPESYYEEVRLVYRERVDAMMKALEDIGDDVVAPRPAGAFYSMVRLPVDDTEAFARFLVERFRSGGESVVVAPGPGFYADPSSGRNEVRLAAVSEVPILRRAVGLLAEGVHAFNAERRR
jgi:aspartate aminotransferase